MQDLQAGEASTVMMFGSLFGGGEGAGIGARAAGLTPLWSVEFSPDIAAVAEMNGFHSLVADARSVDYATLPRVDWLHASPPCINASVAKSDAGETALDGELADAVCRAIRDIQPDTFSLENVIGYRHFDSYTAICRTLTDLGYSYEAWTLNASNYGVAQTRKRLILLARRGTWRIQRPEPTHVKGGDMWLPAWIGWYEAIEDLLPTLLESKFADWQLARLPEGLMTTTLVNANQSESAALVCRRSGQEPAQTITSNAIDRTRAFLVAGNHTTGSIDVGMREALEPSFTIKATVDKGVLRAWLSQGRVVSLTPRALARLMSVPDSYMLPDKASLACRVLGNAVPPLMMQRIVESVKGQADA